MEKLNTIQKRNNLNHVYTIDEKGAGNAHHAYAVMRSEVSLDDLLAQEENQIAFIQFQNGPRFEEGSQRGVGTMDLLEICRHQLTCFQTGDMASRENAIALTHIEEALLWLNKRAEDRVDRGVLGTTNK